MLPQRYGDLGESIHAVERISMAWPPGQTLIRNDRYCRIAIHEKMVLCAHLG
jgi:hypothetical protein